MVEFLANEAENDEEVSHVCIMVCKKYKDHVFNEITFLMDHDVSCLVFELLQKELLRLGH